MNTAPDATDANISGVLGQYMTWKDDTYETVAVALACSAQTVGRKMRGERRWDAHEVAALAARYGVPVSVFYEGPDALMSGSSKSRNFRRDLIAA